MSHPPPPPPPRPPASPSMELRDFEIDFQLASEYLDERLRHIVPISDQSSGKMVNSASCPSFSSMLAASTTASSATKPWSLHNNRWNVTTNPSTIKREKRKTVLKASSSMSNLVDLGSERCVPADLNWQRKRKAPEAPECDAYGYFVDDIAREELLGIKDFSLDPIDELVEESSEFREPTTSTTVSMSTVTTSHDTTTSGNEKPCRTDPIAIRKQVLRDALGPKSEAKIENMDKYDLFSDEKAATTAGSLWLLLHAWKCRAAYCRIPNCDIMKKVADHCVECEKTNCAESCNQARIMLLHYAECGKVNPTRASQCNVCSRLKDLDKAARYSSSISSSNSSSSISCSNHHPVHRKILPNASIMPPIPVDPVVYQTKIQEAMKVIISEQMFSNIRNGTPLLPIRTVQMQAQWLVDQDIQRSLYLPHATSSSMLSSSYPPVAMSMALSTSSTMMKNVVPTPLNDKNADRAP